MNKEQKIDIINRAIDLDQEFGNKIVDMVDIWRDTINSELKRYNKHKIKALLIISNEIIQKYGEKDEQI